MPRTGAAFILFDISWYCGDIDPRPSSRAPRAAITPEVKEPREIGRTKGGMNTKLDFVCDSERRPLRLFVTAGQFAEAGNPDRQVQRVA